MPRSVEKFYDHAVQVLVQNCVKENWTACVEKLSTHPDHQGASDDELTDWITDAFYAEFRRQDPEDVLRAYFFIKNGGK